MRLLRRCLCLAFALLTVVPATAHADYIYTIHYDALTGVVVPVGPGDLTQVFDYSAGSVSFVVPVFLSGTFNMPISTPGASLNGLAFNTVYAYGDYNDFNFSVPPSGSFTTGELNGWIFGLVDAPLGVGTYPTTDGAMRSIDVNGNSFQVWGSGSLTITEVASVPDPASSLLLFGTALAGLVALRRQRG